MYTLKTPILLHKCGVQRGLNYMFYPGRRLMRICISEITCHEIIEFIYLFICNALKLTTGSYENLL